MAVYKVPQDVEAEDKLIGPFSFRQFIYLIVAALGIFLAWALSKVFVALLIIPLPIVIAMLALALPLRKDQPMETYLIAMIKFFFKPRRRLWDPEGTLTFVQITAPKVVEGPQLKEVAGEEASQRLAYLSQIVDTQGWASRGVMDSGHMSDIFVADANKAEDVLDETSSLAQSLDQRITQADDSRMQAMKQQFQASLQQPEPPADPLPSVFPAPTVTPPTPQALTPEPSVTPDTTHTPPVFNPYPTAIHQKVLSPTPQPSPAPAAIPATLRQPPAEARAEKAMPKAVSPDIIRLANNNDLSISAIAREAERLHEDDQNEVVISLR